MYDDLKEHYKGLGYVIIKEMQSSTTGNTFCFLAVDNKTPYIEILKLQENTYNLPHIHLAYEVEDIEKSYQELIDLWYEEVRKPWLAAIVRQNAFLIMPDKKTYIELITV